LVKIGHIVDPPCTAKLYRPLMPKNDINSTVASLYPGITIARDVSFGPDTMDIVDVFSAEKGSDSRPVLLYVPGGAGNKIEQQAREANAFYDNIMRWATQNGMVGVMMQRHPGKSWDDGGKDISLMVQWVQANIGKYKGNPDRMVIWAQSAGNQPLAVYIGRPELWGPRGVGVKGAIFMSAGAFNILPLKLPPGPPGGGGNPLALAGKTCGGNMTNEDGAIAGPGRAAARPAGAGGGGGGRGPQPDEATLLGRSNLPELKKTDVKLMFASAELDPGVDGAMSPFSVLLHDELCKEGPAHCPTMLFEKGESHMSEVFSIDTPDTTVSKPILTFIKKSLK
jgi:triacylglycerol lipase